MSLIDMVVEILTVDGYEDVVVDAITDELIVGRRWDTLRSGPSGDVVKVERSRVVRVREY